LIILSLLKKYFLLFLLFISVKINATHIVGGEISYDDLGGGKYRIILKAYRDCFNGIPPLDGDNTSGQAIPALITVRETIGDILFGVFDIGSPVITNIPPTINSPCIQTPGGICVQEGVYNYTITLPPKTGGYYIAYQRCCRNNTILNLTQSGGQGSTYFTRIPGPEEFAFNSAPRYKNFPPIFICNQITFTFDHSAIDPDGDQLVYSLCPPFLGADGCCPTITGGSPGTSFCNNPPPTCPAEGSTLPYSPVNYASGYSGSYPIASSPAFSINPTTGVLTGKPNLIGQFVVGVCVQEFRNGVLINTHYRDFQFNIVPCVVSVVSDFPPQVQLCQGSTLTFTNQSTSNLGPMTYHWDFGVTAINSDTSNLVNPTYTYADTGKYTVSLITNPGTLCGDTSQRQVYVYPPLDINFQKVNKQCLKNNSFNFLGQGAYINSTTFNWDFTSAATPSTATTLTVNNVSFNQAGLYFVKLLAKQFACIDSFIDSVRVIGRPKAQINNLGTNLCDPAKVAFANGSTSYLPLTYLWQFSNGNSSTAFEPTETFSPPGVYGVTLTVKTSSLCIDTSMFAVSNITVNPKPFAGFTYSPQVTSIFDPAIFINNNASGDVVNWNYTFGDGTGTGYPSETHIYQDYGDYVITQIVNNVYGCTDTIRQTVKILPEFRFWIPNCFTPDDNLLNDFFMPIAIGVIQYNFEIFDRWGELIFKTNNPKQGWNGFYRGKECKQDVYVWRITFKNVVSEAHEVHYGHVTLLKNL
jgi:gliding motility-associated-like protein